MTYISAENVALIESVCGPLTTRSWTTNDSRLHISESAMDRLLNQARADGIRGRVTGKTAIWSGNEDVLPAGAAVEVLATDPTCPDMRGAAWVRYWPKERDYPMYRSCDLGDLEFIGDELR